MAAMAFLVLVTLAAASAAGTCTVCHPKETAALAQSGMGRSFRPLPVDTPDGEFQHAASGSTVRIRGAAHSIASNRRVAAEATATYAVGSGNAGMSFLVRLGGEWLFQSPAAYFSRRQAWGPSPGYEVDATLDFSRPIPEECVFCHAGSADFVEGSLNRFRNPPAAPGGLPCERCHGDGSAHAAGPSPKNIVNPARLEGVARDSVCEQCHLGGVARVLNSGQRWRDFSPGARLEDIGSVYVWERSDPASPLHVVSHVEQLAASACARESQGRLWCGSCHRVHGGRGAESAAAACGQCHAAPSLERHAAATARRGTCASCHMPKRPAADGGHTAFTDHRIQRRPASRASAGAAAEQGSSLRAWRPPSHGARNQGLAYIQAGDRLPSADLVQRGFRLLAERQQQYARDPDVLAALGYVLLKKNRPREASALLERAVRLAPENIRFRLNLGLAQASSGESAPARETLEDLLRRDPSLGAARQALEQIRK